MKKILLFLFFVPMLLFGECFTTEFRIGYFYPSSHLMRDIYPRGGVEFELEASKRFDQNLSGWININYFQKEGHSSGLHHKTRLQLVPISLGFNYIYPFTSCLSLYLGAGPSYTFLETQDHSRFLKHYSRKYAWGGVAKSGLLYTFTECLFLDLFFDYYYTKICTRNNNLNAGGLRTGLGLGINF